MEGFHYMYLSVNGVFNMGGYRIQTFGFLCPFCPACPGPGFSGHWMHEKIAFGSADRRAVENVPDVPPPALSLFGDSRRRSASLTL